MLEVRGEERCHSGNVRGQQGSLRSTASRKGSPEASGFLAASVPGTEPLMGRGASAWGWQGITGVKSGRVW